MGDVVHLVDGNCEAKEEEMGFSDEKLKGKPCDALPPHSKFSLECTGSSSSFLLSPLTNFQTSHQLALHPPLYFSPIKEIVIPEEEKSSTVRPPTPPQPSICSSPKGVEEEVSLFSFRARNRFFFPLPCFLPPLPPPFLDTFPLLLFGGRETFTPPDAETPSRNPTSPKKRVVGRSIEFGRNAGVRCSFFAP